MVVDWVEVLRVLGELLLAVYALLQRSGRLRLDREVNGELRGPKGSRGGR